MNGGASASDVGATGSGLRVVVWALHMSLPLGALWLLVAQPRLDLGWEHHGAHFALVVAAGGVSCAVALVMRREARHRSDARLTLVAFAFLTAAAFLFLHGFTTPQVLLTARTSGFVLAAPVGLMLAAVFAVWSSLDLADARAAAVVRWDRALLVGLGVFVTAWAVVSLVPADALEVPLAAEGSGWVTPLAGAGIALYVVAITRYAVLYRRRPAVMLISVITAFTLLAQSLLTVALSRPWQLSWWQWHVLMLVGFGFVAYSARLQYRREGSSSALFAAVTLEQTVRRIREEHRAALEALLGAMRRQNSTGEPTPAAVRPAAARVAARFGLTEAQADVLAGAAEATYEVDALRRQLDALLHVYVSPDIAETLIGNPELAELGGRTADVTVVLADLRGFTPFAEQRSPAEVVALLNRYFQRAVPLVLDRGGTVVQFVGDELMALFGAPQSLPDHPRCAAEAALAIHRAVEHEVGDEPEWPRFRIGVNTGPALVGNIGGQVRNFTAIGDTTNLAARLEGLAEPGEVVIGPVTRAARGDRAVIDPLGPVTVKGRAQPVEAYVLHDVVPTVVPEPGGAR